MSSERITKDQSKPKTIDHSQPILEEDNQITPPSFPTHPSHILNWQQTIGNQATQEMIAKPHLKTGRGTGLPPVRGVVQAKSKVPDQEKEGEEVSYETAVLMPVDNKLQRAPKGKRGNQAENIAKLTTLKSNADTRFKLTNDFSTKSLEIGDLTRDKLVILSNMYKEGYGNFRAVLDKAQQEAQNQQDWTNIIIGVACGVAAGLLAAWILPSSAAAAFALTLEEAGIAAVSSAAQGGAGALASAGLTKALDVEGKILDSKGLEPSIMELEIWKKVSDIYRSGLEYSKLNGALHTLTVNLSDLIGDVRVYDTGGDSNLSDEKINEKIIALEGKDKEAVKLNDEIGKKLTELENIKQSINSIDPAKHSAKKMEKDIWILWMASLPLNSNILDLDEIENYIGPKGLQIVDFGIYTFDSDENEAIEKARDTAGMLRAEQKKMLNPGTEPDIPADKPRQLRVLTR